MLLEQPWPPDLHPNRVPFKRRTLTIMERAGLFNNPAAIDDLTEGDVLGWENVGTAPTFHSLIELSDVGIAEIPHNSRCISSERYRSDSRGVEYLSSSRH